MIFRPVNPHRRRFFSSLEGSARLWLVLRWFFAALCIVAMLFSLFSALYISVLEMPLTVMIATDEKLDEYRQTLRSGDTRMTALVKEADENTALTRQDRAYISVLKNKWDAVYQRPCIAALLPFVNHYQDSASDPQLREVIRLPSDLSSLVRSLSKLRFLVICFAVIITLVFAALTVLAAYLNKSGFALAALLLGIHFAFEICGTGTGILILITCGALFCNLIYLNHLYRAHLRAKTR